jgi:hypothetical protein
VQCNLPASAERFWWVKVPRIVFDQADKTPMSEELNELLNAARLAKPTPEQREAQRRSFFVYGNTHLENELITREMLDRAAEILRKEHRH